MCRTETAPVGGSYIIDSPFGLRVVEIGSRDAEEMRGEGHLGQLLKVMGEAGVSRDASVRSETGTLGTISDVFSDAAARFTLEGELEFFGDAVLLWLPAGCRWKNRFGDELSSEALLRELVRQPLGSGSCIGTHAPYTIAMHLAVNADEPFLSRSSLESARRSLQGVSDALSSRQAAGKLWDERWARESAPRGPYSDVLLDRINVTGHHLEWIAIAPPELRPAERVIQAAVESMCEDIANLPPIQTRTFKSVLPCSHAARALSLMAGIDPFPYWSGLWTQGRLVKSLRQGYVLRK